MSTVHQHRPSKEQFWRATLRQWRSSGLSVRVFCAQRRLSEPSFYAWRRSLGERDAAATAFLPVRVAPEPAPAPQTTPEGAEGALELVLGPGRRLQIRPGFDAATLRRLLAVLEESRP